MYIMIVWIWNVLSFFMFYRHSSQLVRDQCLTMVKMYLFILLDALLWLLNVSIYSIGCFTMVATCIYLFIGCFYLFHWMLHYGKCSYLNWMIALVGNPAFVLCFSINQFNQLINPSFFFLISGKKNMYTFNIYILWKYLYQEQYNNRMQMTILNVIQHTHLPKHH